MVMMPENMLEEIGNNDWLFADSSNHGDD